MTIISLFSGIAGLDIAVEALLGVGPSYFAERDPFCQKILARHFPGVPIFSDVTEIGNLGADVVCGGFPCQPHSLAGKRGASEDKRDLWPEVVRVVEANRPRLVLLENVPGLLTSESGAFFHGMMRDLDRIGYAARWDMCEVSAVGGPHRRDRVFLVCVPVAAFRQPGPVQGRPVSMFGHADEPTWPRAGWYSAGRWGVERARWPKGRAAVAWPTPDAGAANLDESSESWHARAAMLKEKHGNGNGAGTPLAVAVRDADAGTARAWPTPRCGLGSMYPESDAANANRGGESVATAALSAERAHRAQLLGILDRAAQESTGDARATWPTPRAEDAELCGAHRGVPDTLLSAIRAARTWPTPAAGDEKNTRNATANRDGSKGGQGLGVIGQTLCDAVEIESGKWPTPTAGNAEGGRTTTGGRDTPTSLNMAARSVAGGVANDSGLWPTPRASEGEKGVGPLGSASHDHHVAHGYLNATIQEATKSTGALNPEFSGWLMGFPAGWTEPTGQALPHTLAGWTDCELTYYGGRPAPKGMALLTTVKLHRRNRLKGLGNAVVGRAAFRAFAALVDAATFADLADQSGPSIALADVV